LKDSGKKVRFDENGYIWIVIESIEEDKLISSLSSGEAQIFVILTHLAFNPLAQGANVFIIDEPELSLHVQWQELFVDSIMSVNPNIQYIPATHSPSIILERDKKCYDIGKLNLRRAPRA
jgi:predicted ATP-binding protein involved in virulence